jgi:hypothetical protein
MTTIDCRYCHKNHHIRDCPKLLAKKQHQQTLASEQQVTQQLAHVAAKPNSWSSIAAKGRSPELVDKLDKEHQQLLLIQQQQQTDKLQRETQQREQRRILAKQRAEQKIIQELTQIFGVKTNKYAHIGVQIGDFWYFYTQGNIQDPEIAKQMRIDPSNIQRFHAYLREKWFINWIFSTEDSEDDCHHLRNLRDLEEQRCAEQQRQAQLRIEEEHRRRKLQKIEMKRQLAAGEITRRQYIDWKFDCYYEDELDVEGYYY